MLDLEATTRFIAKWEGFRARPYRNFPNEPWTVGYGDTDPDFVGLFWNEDCSERIAFERLRDRVSRFAEDVQELVHRQDLLNVNRLGALTSLAYNIGIGALADSTALRRLNEGDLVGAGEAISWWNKVDGQVIEGLARRRNEEVAWFNTKVAGGNNMRYPEPLGAQFVLANIASSYVLDELAQHDGALAYCAGLHGGDNQKWALVLLEDGWNAMICIKDGRALSIADGSTDDGAAAVMWPWHDGDDQKWFFAQHQGKYGIYTMQNKKSGKLLVTQTTDNGSRCVLGPKKTHGQRELWTGVWCLSSPPPPNDPPILFPPTAPPPPPEPDPEQIDHDWAEQQIYSWGFRSIEDFQRAFAFWDITIDNQMGSETAMAVKTASDRGDRMSHHFHVDELRSKGDGTIRCNRRLLQGLERVREQVGSVQIISCYRDPVHNKNVGGAGNSQHLYGNAADVSLPYDVVRNLNWFSGIGIVEADGTVAHVDVRHDGPNTTGGTPDNPTIWYYR